MANSLLREKKNVNITLCGKKGHTHERTHLVINNKVMFDVWVAQSGRGSKPSIIIAKFSIL